MSNTHAAPASAPAAHAAAPSTNAWKEFGAEVTAETIENWTEDLVKRTLPGTEFAKALVKRFPFAKVKFFGTVMANALALGVRMLPWLPEASKDAVALLVRHVALGLNEGAAETIKTQAEWDHFVDHASLKIDPKDRIPDVGEFQAIVSERLDYFHKPECAILLRDMTNFAADNPARKEKQKVGTKRVGNRDVDVEETIDIKKPYPSKPKDLFKLLAHPSGPCPVCYKGEFPAHKDEKHPAKGLKEKLGQKAIDVFLAANATIAAMGTGKLFAIDEIQEWKDIDPDLIKAAAERLHPKITADGKLPHAELEELLTLIPTAGVEKLSALNAVGKAIKTVKEFAGEPAKKKEEKPVLEACGPEFMDCLRDSNRRYAEMKRKKKKEFSHLTKVHLLPDLSRLAVLAQLLLSPAGHPLGFADDAEFMKWSQEVKLLVIAHEFDQNRKNPTLRAMAKTSVGWLKTTRLVGVLLCLAMVAGWVMLGFKDVQAGEVVNGTASSVGMTLIIGASVGLVILALLLLLPEWALKAGDIFFPKWNKTDESVASVRWKVSAAVGVLFVNGCLAYADLVQLMGCLMIFGASIVLPIVTSALLRMAGAYFDLLRSQRVAGLLYSAIVGAIPATMLVSILMNANPELHDLILRGVAMTVLGIVFLLGAWKVTTMILAKTEQEHGHSIAMVLVACVAGLALLLLGTKFVLMAKKLDLSQISVPAPQTGLAGMNGALKDSGDALEAAKRKALALKAGTATSPAPTMVDTTPATETVPTPAPAPAPTKSNAKPLTKAQAKAEIAKLEKALAKEYGDNVPALAELEKKYSEDAKKLTALNNKFGADSDGIKSDAEYQDLVGEMERLSGEIDLRRQIEAIENGQKASPKVETQKPVASAAVASEATEAVGGPDDETDGLKVYCQKLAKKAPLVYAQTPTCQGV